MAKKPIPSYDPMERIDEDFRVTYFKDLAEMFGEARAAAMLTTARRKRQAKTAAEEMSDEVVDVTMVFLGMEEPRPGVKYGPRSSMALKAFRGYVADDEANRASVKKFLLKNRARLAKQNGAASEAPPE